MENFSLSDIGDSMSVTNEDLRNDITKINGILRELTNVMVELKDGNNDRRKDSERINLLYTGLSVLRWALGLFAASAIGVAYQGYNDLHAAMFVNAEQARQIQDLKDQGIAREVRMQALERGQFATSIKEPK